MNRYVIIGWLGSDSKIFFDYDMKKGEEAARAFAKNPAWRPVWTGSLIDLIDALDRLEKMKK